MTIFFSDSRTAQTFVNIFDLKNVLGGKIKFIFVVTTRIGELQINNIKYKIEIHPLFTFKPSERDLKFDPEFSSVQRSG